jgi:Pup amidohydrolase
MCPHRQTIESPVRGYCYYGEVMAVPKVCGIETEYGIVLRGGESNPILASSILVNAYVQHLGRDDIAGRPTKVSWDFEDESPGIDARGWTAAGAMPPEVETHLVNAVLTNGARYYVDHAHPEYSSPECRTPKSATLYDRSGEIVMQRSMEAAKLNLPPGQEIVVYKNNSDGKGNSYGTHENYLMDRTVPFSRVVNSIMPFFVTRQIFTGSGKVGSEFPGAGDDVPFQLTQRADFFEEEVGLETTLKRPIVNTRDEPHSDAQRYRRLHVITGDATMSEYATYLKLGTACIVLAMIEDQFFESRAFSLAASVQAMRLVSWDLSVKRPLELADGRTMSALEMQWEFLRLAQQYSASHGLECIDPDGLQGPEILAMWEETLTDLERDPLSTSDRLDWSAKYRLFDAYRERHQLNWRDAKIKALDLQWHDVRPEKSLGFRQPWRRVLDDADIVHGVLQPPRDTRAYFRGKCLQLFSPWIAAANWDSIVFDLGTDPLRRVPMLEPLKGTSELVDSLLEGCDTPAQLLDRLGA